MSPSVIDEVPDEMVHENVREKDGGCGTSLE